VKDHADEKKHNSRNPPFSSSKKFYFWQLEVNISVRLHTFA
jgi:hypothetical protein